MPKNFYFLRNVGQTKCQLFDHKKNSCFSSSLDNIDMRHLL